MNPQLVDQQSRGMCTSVVKVGTDTQFSIFTPSLLSNTTTHRVKFQPHRDSFFSLPKRFSLLFWTLNISFEFFFYLEQSVCRYNPQAVDLISGKLFMLTYFHYQVCFSKAMIKNKTVLLCNTWVKCLFQ